MTFIPIGKLRIDQVPGGAALISRSGIEIRRVKADPDDIDDAAYRPLDDLRSRLDATRDAVGYALESVAAEPEPKWAPRLLGWGMRAATALALIGASLLAPALWPESGAWLTKFGVVALVYLPLVGLTISGITLAHVVRAPDRVRQLFALGWIPVVLGIVWFNIDDPHFELVAPLTLIVLAWWIEALFGYLSFVHWSQKYAPWHLIVFDETQVLEKHSAITPVVCIRHGARGMEFAAGALCAEGKNRHFVLTPLNATGSARPDHLEAAARGAHRYIRQMRLQEEQAKAAAVAAEEQAKAALEATTRIRHLETAREELENP